MTIISWSLRDSSGPVDIPISSLDNARLIAEYQSLTPDDRIWCYLPLFFSAGICNILFGTFSSGATLVLQETFDPGEALRLIHDERCTVYHGFANAFKRPGITYELERGEAVLRLPISASERLRQMIVNMVENIATNRPHITVFFEERRRLSSKKFSLVKEKRDRYEQLFRQVVVEGIQTGEFCADSDPRIIAFAILGMCNWTYQWLQSGKGFSAREIGNMFCDLLFQGLLTSQNSD